MSSQSIRDLERFDMARAPVRQRLFLLPLTWAISLPSVLLRRTKIKRVGTKGIKPPYLLLCNHNAFYDFMVTTAAIFPRRAAYVVAIDGFIGREWLLRNVGCICKRKFTNSPTLVRHLRKVIENGDIAVLYPEARYSLCGTGSALPESLGKLAKLLDVPVVTLIMHGHHICSPFWNLDKRGGKTEAEFSLLYSKEELKSLSASEISAGISKAFEYDDFAWQRENNVKIDYKNRAAGLHKVLYQCPACGAEYKMRSGGAEIWCEACGKRWAMDELGRLQAKSVKTEFSHIPDWYEWQRAQVRKEIEAGKYSFSCRADVYSLPNAKGYIPFGEGTLTHDMNGFVLRGEYRGEEYVVEKNPLSLYSCHIEYEYLGKYGDCVDISTLSDTYYVYPKNCDFSVTKIALATEELYKFKAGKSGV